MPTAETPTAHPWREQEITLHAQRTYANAYTDVQVWADFTHEDGTTLRRPAFWDGGRTWKIRFASPLDSGTWTWRTAANVDDAGLAGQIDQAFDQEMGAFRALLLDDGLEGVQPLAGFLGIGIGRQGADGGRGHALLLVRVVERPGPAGIFHRSLNL